MCHPETIQSSSHNSDLWNYSIGTFGFLATCCSGLLLLLLPDANLSTSLESWNNRGEEDASTANAVETCSNRCTLSWITASEFTKAECSVFEPRSSSTTTRQAHENKACMDALAVSDKEEGFDPAQSAYFGVKLTPSVASTDVETKDMDTAAIETPTSSILHNTIVVLPKLMTQEECHHMVLNAERILEENKKKDQQGCRTESWTMYARFDDDCQQVMDRVLGTSILDFLEQRMPTVAEQLFENHKYIRSRRSSSSAADKAQERVVEDLKEKVRYHWDDPVVIKYTEGNELAPHEDMRPLTLVIPLNPLEEFPLGGGGTRFWLEGTRPECALESGGVSVRPGPGSGILFNGEITHSGNGVETGTRFVLMTSITLEDPDDEIEWEEDDDDDVTVK